MTSSFATRTFGTTLLLASFFACANPAEAADLSLPVTGNLLGSVTSVTGAPEMGATVEVFDKYQRLVAKTLTTRDGRFGFADLAANLYSVRISLASFVPVFRDRIVVKPGLDSVLQVHMATLLSNVEISYSAPAAGMTDDWKWVLRSSPATRPITRYLPEHASHSESAALRPKVFTGTHAMLSVSGGDGGFIDSGTTRSDLGTGFALSTNFFGKNQLQVGGLVGQDASFGPAAMGLSAIYSRAQDGLFTSTPEVTLTMSQVGRLGPQSATVGATAYDASAGALRSMSLSIYQTADPVDSLHVEYGITGESVDLLQHSARLTPFARTTVDMGTAGQVVAAYSDGGRPDQLLSHQQTDNAELDAPRYDDLSTPVNAVTRLPQVSVRNNGLELQRTRNYEIGYKNTQGNRTFAISAFHESIANGRVSVAGDVSALDSADLLSDGISMTSIYNVGSYHRSGYLASVRQQVNDSLDIAVSYGRMGGFGTNPTGASSGSGVQDKFSDRQNRNVASANLNARAPVAGTRISISYGWMDQGSFVPQHIFTTQNTYISPGFDVYVRQPVPSFFGMPGRLEVTADLRNLLAQGYVPLNCGNGHTLLMVQSPRAVRGGLNFIF